MDKIIISYTYKERWRKRNLDIVNLITPFTGTVLDLGCGDKDILNFFTIDKNILVTDYIGLDRVDKADIVTDLDNEVVNLEKTYDIGLAIGVLEYLQDPFKTLKSYKPYAKRWIILTHFSRVDKTPKSFWNQRFFQEDITKFQETYKKVELKNFKTHLIWDCK